MPYRNNDGGAGGPWGRGTPSGPDFEDLVRQGQDRLKQVMPSGSPRGLIVLAVLALLGLGAWSTEIYARAYNRSPEAVAFYEFIRTMQAYKAMIAENTTLVFSTESDLFKFLKGMAPDGVVAPADGPAIATKIQESDLKP